MGIGYNTSIVRDGLVLHLDAANVKSYSGSGTTWTDLSGNGNNGTLVNGVGHNSGSLGSLNFDGSNDYVEISDAPFRRLDPNFSIEIIFYYGGGSILYPLIGKRNASSPYNQYTLGIYSGSPYSGGPGNVLGWFLRKDGGNSSTDRTTTFTLTTSGIYHAAVTNDTSAAKLYVNGVLRSTSTVSLGTNPTYSISSKNLRIAEYYNNDYFSGNIYSAKFYNRALSEGEVRQNFNALRGRYGI